MKKTTETKLPQKKIQNGETENTKKKIRKTTGKQKLKNHDKKCKYRKQNKNHIYIY